MLPTHEQAWLFAAARPLLTRVPVAVTDFASCGRVQSKIEFARLLDEIGLPQPQWQLVADQSDLTELPFPYWLKTAFSTAGRGVRHGSDQQSRTAATNELLEETSGLLMGKNPLRVSTGRSKLCSIAGLVAAHTSVQVGTGIGPRAAARVSVDHPQPRRDAAMLGEALAWHGGLTLDYASEAPKHR